MLSLRFRAKLLILLLLGFATFTANVDNTAHAVSCGKCDTILASGQVVGWACINTGNATHGCTATASGCTFSDPCDPPNPD